jgi:pyrroloquinoline-quinone synthase
MNTCREQPPLNQAQFVEWLRNEGKRRYHHQHPFHQLMHEGRLTSHQLQRWVLNRYYYQTRIPIKDALILSKSEDPTFRRAWIRRIHDHDGTEDGDGGLALWGQLARGVGLDEKDMLSLQSVLPDVRLACDEYVSFVRNASLVEAVAASLTELFAPDIMSQRLAAWAQHYPWVDRSALEYFRSRIPRATRDSEEALSFVMSHAGSYELQTRCVAALVRKTEILWRLLDSLYAAYVPSMSRKGADHDRGQLSYPGPESTPAVRSDLG